MITMYFNDHPPPHVHARVGRLDRPGGYVARVAIDTGQVIAGSLPVAKSRRVSSWCNAHESVLLANWEAMQRDEPPPTIYPSK